MLNGGSDMTFEVSGNKYMIRGKDSDICPSCGSKDIRIDHENFETYCAKWGHVINDYSIEYGTPSLKKDDNKWIL